MSLDDATMAVLDGLSFAQLQAYFVKRRIAELRAESAVDGWERLAADVEMSGGEITIEDGSWVWRDEAGRIRRAFGYLGGSHPAAMTFDEEGRDVCSWELRDDPNPRAQNLDDLAAVRASVMASPITREELDRPFVGTDTAAPGGGNG